MLRKTSSWFCLVTGLAALAYIIYKAASNSFTHDEAFTWNRWVFRSYFDIIFYYGQDIIPNNHILKSVLMKTSEWMFGSREFALRLPNVLAGAGFLLLSYRWLKTFEKPWLTIIGFIVMVCNPYLLDFFTLARGYGLSSFFLLATLVSFTRYVSSGGARPATGMFILAAFAVWSNFILLICFGALWFVFVLYLLLRLGKSKVSLAEKAKQFYQAVRKPLIVSIVLFLVIIRPLIVMSGDLFGPGDGFWTNTVRSLILSSTNNEWPQAVDPVGIFVALVTMAAAILFFMDLHRNQYDAGKSPHFLFFLLAVVPAGITMLQHGLFQVPFLEGRTGLPFLVLFGFLTICLLHYLALRWRDALPIVVSVPFCLFLLSNFFANARLGYNITWQYEKHTKEILKIIGKDRNIHAPDRIRLGITWIFEPTINYYRKTRRLDWLEKVTRDGYEGDYDYYYVEKDSAYLSRSHRVILQEYKDIQTYLAKSTR